MIGRRDPEARARTALTAALTKFRRAAQGYALRHGRADFILEPAPAPLPRKEFTGCRVFSDRQALLAAMARGSVGVEVGVGHGGLSRFLLASLPLDRLHLIDITFDKLGNDVAADRRVMRHLGPSVERLAALPDRSADFIYIDADHSYAACRADADAAIPKLAPDGLLVFNDYSVWTPLNVVPFGVPRVVHELIAEGWRLAGLTLGDVLGSHDVALAAPSAGTRGSTTSSGPTGRSGG